MLQRRVVLALILLGVAPLMHAAEINGRILSAVTGQPLGRVQVTLTRSSIITADDGQFTFPVAAPGEYLLRVTAVGYRLITVPVTLAADEPVQELEITLVPDNLRRDERVEVKGDRFQGGDSPATLEMNLTGPELRETSTVLANDPFRSIQSLPGVSAAGNNDFFAQFSVLGAPYSATGIYVDGVLVSSPFHGTDITQGATLSLFTSDTLEGIKLLPAAYPEQYGDTVGAALDLETRDGSRTPPSFRFAAGLADTELLGEGQLGRARRGSWLASGRKSYLGYLFRNRLSDTSDDVSFYDSDLKLVYDLRPGQTVSLYGIGGSTLYQLVHPTAPPGPEDIEREEDHFILGRAGWRWTATPSLLLQARAAWQQQPHTESNVDRQPLLNAHYSEWSGGGTADWSWRTDQVLEAGWTVRRATSSAVDYNYFAGGTSGQVSGTSASGWKHDGYLQDAATLHGVHLLGSLRLDTATLFDTHPVSPQLSAAVPFARETQLKLGYGRYRQFDFPSAPPLDLTGSCSFSEQNLFTADHYTAALEHRFGESTRGQALLFDRQDGGSYAARASQGCPAGLATRGFVTVEHDYSRGAQIVLQSRTANKLSGWVGYTLTYARQRSTSAVQQPFGQHALYPTLTDQRHTVNLFASYRLSPTVSVSGKFLYGSGFPIPDGTFNANRLGDYQRLDVRAEKDWAYTRWKLSLYGEVLNLTDHRNPRYFYSSFDQKGNATAVTGQDLPILPTAGIAFAF